MSAIDHQQKADTTYVIDAVEEHLVVRLPAFVPVLHLLSHVDQPTARTPFAPKSDVSRHEAKTVTQGRIRVRGCTADVWQLRSPFRTPSWPHPESDDGTRRRCLQTTMNQIKIKNNNI